jgi:hypothetical protein
MEIVTCGVWMKVVVRELVGDLVKAVVGFARLFRPTYPDFLHGAPPTAARAAFIKESRMKFANASKVYRKSGVRWGERGAPVLFPRARSGPWDPVVFLCGRGLTGGVAGVEMWGTRRFATGRKGSD